MLCFDCGNDAVGGARRESWGDPRVDRVNPGVGSWLSWDEGVVYVEG